MEVETCENGQKILFTETISSLILLSISRFFSLMHTYAIF